MGTMPARSFWLRVKEISLDPMLILLAVATIIYFVLGSISDALFMSGAIIFIVSISIYQSNRTSNALRALKEFSRPGATVIRDNSPSYVKTDDIVVGDFVVVSEGELIAADGIIRQLNDFSANESILTGEAYSVTKSIESSELATVYRGSLVESGQCVFEVTAVGDKTRLGRLGKEVQDIQKEKSPLQRQVSLFVRWMSAAGSFVFMVIWAINYFHSRDILDSLLKGLTIAMSVLPEEIPVAIVSFMAIGSWRLMKEGIIVKDPSVVEALGAATVICLDKTGTITENKMEIAQIYDFKNDVVESEDNWKKSSVRDLIHAAMLASETVPFDNMERSIQRTYENYASLDDRPRYTKIFEYPLSGHPPMMTHVFRTGDGQRIIAMKGAPEAILKGSVLNEEEKRKVTDCLSLFAEKGFRVLGVGTANFGYPDLPADQQEFKIDFLGLIAFYDPPKRDIKDIFSRLYAAGIKLKIITGDNPVTTAAIAKQSGFIANGMTIVSSQLLKMDEGDFDRVVIENDIFTRMFPDLKLKVIQSLKRRKHVVGMTGDGVNDGPALKAADIGIAMGKRGSEIAKEAASIILSDDDFGKVTDAVAMGRKIYANLKKAVRYIISIHIPIILMVLLPLIMNWTYPFIFTPVHVIFFELVMGPTCSIVYENEPLEPNAMLHKPRMTSAGFFRLNELAISIVQGLIITLGILIVYQLSVFKGFNETLTRSMVFGTLIFANVFLTFANRSFDYSLFVVLRYKNRLLWIIVITTLFLLAAILYVPALSLFFDVTALRPGQLGLAAFTAFASVMWVEVFKGRRDLLGSDRNLLR
jgi:Ca2+-transporting ATPase